MTAHRRRWPQVAAGLAGLAALLMLAATPAWGQSPAPATSPAMPGVVDADGAAGLVLASDALFAGLASRAQTLATFTTASASWYDVRQTMTGSYVVEVMLVGGDCEVTLPGRAWPCEWRHDVLFRVTPDGQVSRLYDDGDPLETRPGASVGGSTRLADEPQYIGPAEHVAAVPQSHPADRMPCRALGSPLGQHHQTRLARTGRSEALGVQL